MKFGRFAVLCSVVCAGNMGEVGGPGLFQVRESRYYRR